MGSPKILTVPCWCRARSQEARCKMKSSNATKIGHAIWVLVGLMLGGLFGRAGTSLATEYTWAQKADMPTARWAHSASVVDRKIYVIGGTKTDELVGLNAVEEYDPSVD